MNDAPSEFGDLIVLDTDLACIVGILPRERIEPQPLEIELEMGIDLDPCGTTGRLEHSVDYGSIDAQLRYLCTQGRFRLIEVLSVAILRLVLAPPGPGEARAPLARASVQLRKPTVLRAAVPGVRLSRDAEWVHDSDVLADVREVLARRVELSPGDVFEGTAGQALRIDGDARVVELPFRASEPCTLLYVETRE